MVARTPAGDVFDEFSARVAPYGYNHTEQEKNAKPPIEPEEDGKIFGVSKIPVQKSHLVSRLRTWNNAYSAKQRIIEGEIRDHEQRRGGASSVFMLSATLVVSIVLFLVAMAVDYAVISEFWSNVYSDRFGEVPSALRDSILFKGGQVLVAAFAFHFFYQSLTRDARKWFIYFVFGITLTLLLGLGFLNAVVSQSEDSPYSIEQQNDDDSGDDILRQFGLDNENENESGQQDESTPTDTKKDDGQTIRRAFSWIWLTTLSFLFVSVTATAVMILHVGLRAAAGLFGRIDNEYYYSNKSVLNRADINYRLSRARRAREWISSPKTRRELLFNDLTDFQIGYIRGLDEAFGREMSEEDESKRNALLQTLEESMKEAEEWLSENEDELVYQPDEEWEDPNPEEEQHRQERAQRKAAQGADRSEDEGGEAEDSDTSQSGDERSENPERAKD